MLEIKKDDFRSDEMKKWLYTKIVLVLEFALHVIKVVLPLVTLIECRHFDEDQCKVILDHRITMLLLCDVINAGLLWLYVVFVVVKLFSFMRKYSRFEYNKHKLLLTCNFLGLLISLPLCMMGKYFWIVDFCKYVHFRGFFYMQFISCVLPATTYIFTRADHDCFNCFNRIAPRPYSCF